MARTVQQIQNSMDAEQASQASLSTNLTSPSQTAIYKLWKYITAVCINLLEQLWDIFKVDLEKQIASAPVGTEPFIQKKVFEFQYDATTPQLLTLVNFAPVYSPVDITKRIITRCSVKTAPDNIVNVKVATGNPPAALSSPQLSALQSYLTSGGDGTYAGRGRGLGFAGINVKAISLSPDYLYLAGKIYYNGQYASTIQTSVIAAIYNYMANLPFDGYVTLLALTDAIQSVAGVNDINLTDVAVRSHSTGFGSKTYMIQSSLTIITNYPTYAGYIVEEVTTSNTFSDKLIFIPT